MGSYKITLERFLEACEQSGGILMTISRKLGVDWHTVKKFINENPEAKLAVDAELEKVLDAAESVLFGSIINDHNVQDAKWLLTVKGKSRGYSTRTEVDVSTGGEPIKFIEVVRSYEDRTDGE